MSVKGPRRMLQRDNKGRSAGMVALRPLSMGGLIDVSAVARGNGKAEHPDFPVPKANLAELADDDGRGDGWAAMPLGLSTGH